MTRRIIVVLLFVHCNSRIDFAAADADQRARPTKPVGATVGQWRAGGTKGAVVAGGPEAVDAGIEVLKAGGNAVDAAVATLLALSVTDANQFCFGGEVPILVYDPHREVVEVIAGQGTAPRLATFEHFAAKGGIPRQGIEAAAVPATLGACVTALDRFGTRSFTAAVAPTLRILDRHEHAWHADLATTIRTLCAAEATSPSDRLRGLRRVADCFYRGPIARQLDAWSRANGGLLRYQDLATHVTRVEDPVTVDYRGHVICKCGPWTQGPYLSQTLNLLEGYDLASIGANRPDAIHLAVEAMKLTLADRDVHYADPLFEPVPTGRLLSKEYANLRRPLIDRSRASLELRPGDPRGGKPLLADSNIPVGTAGPANDTTTCLVADGAGFVVAATPSGWSGVLAGKTGVWLGSRLQSFNTWQGHPNRIEPGKRPRITLTPTMVLENDKPVLAISVAGGDVQDQVTLQLLLNHIDFGLAPAQSVTAPRFMTNHFVGSFGQTPPRLGSLLLDSGIDAETAAALKNRGHRVTIKRPPIAHPSALAIDPESGRLDAAGDPKAARHASAF